MAGVPFGLGHAAPNAGCECKPAGLGCCRAACLVRAPGGSWSWLWPGGAIGTKSCDISDRLGNKRPSCRVRLARSEEHTSELQSLMRISYAVFCLKKKKNNNTQLRTIAQLQ